MVNYYLVMWIWLPWGVATLGDKLILSSKLVATDSIGLNRFWNLQVQILN